MNDIIKIIEELDINGVRTIDYFDAVEWGLEPRSYDRDIPVGIHRLRLIFKIWGKKNSLRCYFQSINTGQCYLVMFFTNQNNQYRYSARDNLIDFSEPYILGNIYELHVSRTKTGKSRIESAILNDGEH